MSRNQSLTLFERVHERVLRNLSEMSSDPYRFGGRGSVLEQDLVRALEWEHEKCRRLKNELDRVKTRKRHAVRKAISLFEQVQTLQAAVDEGWEWKGEAGWLKEQFESARREEQLQSAVTLLQSAVDEMDRPGSPEGVDPNVVEHVIAMLRGSIPASRPTAATAAASPTPGHQRSDHPESASDASFQDTSPSS